MAGWANGNSLGASANNSVAPGIGQEGGVRWTVPPWKFGTRSSDDRGSI